MLMATLFLGGWDLPGGWDDMNALPDGTVLGAAPAVWKTLVTLLAFMLKTGFFVVVFMLVRWTVPRFRYDQVMDLGWKLMLPTALAVITVTAGTILALDEAGVEYGLVYGLVLTAVNGVMLGAFLWVVDRGRILSGGHKLQERRAHARAMARFRKEEFEVGRV
jgi:NADH-quinone oxidoreductase subunit H